MKKIKYILLILACLGCTACDFFDIAPTTTLSDKSFWKNQDDALAALSSIYEYYAGYNAGMDCITDDAFDKTEYMPYVKVAIGAVTPSNPCFDFFSNYYKIRDCNNFLAKVEDIDMDSKVKEVFKAEARFIRAHEYYYKLVYHGGCPIVTTLINPEDAKLPRNSEKEVLDFLLKELTEIAEVLPNQNLLESKGHFTKGSALGLKARLELYYGKYAEAKQTAKQILNLGVYELFNANGKLSPYDGLRQLFSAQGESENKEALFSAAYLSETYTAGYWQSILPSEFDSYGTLSPTQDLVDSFEYSDGTPFDPEHPRDPKNIHKDRDPRLNAFIVLPGTYIADVQFNPFDKDNLTYYKNNANFGYLPRKYTPLVETAADVDKFKSDIDVMQMRLAEIYLIYAESAIELNQIDESVYEALNAVRNRAGMPDVDKNIYSNQSKLRELVRRERRVELCLEGLRYLDIKRWNIGEQTMKGDLNVRIPEFTKSGNKINFDYSSGAYETVFTRNFVPVNYLFPISQSVLDKNDMLEQNEGYK